MKRMNQAVFYANVRRVRRGYYECTMELITREPQKYKDFDLTEEYFRRLETSIRRDPAIYLWSHNRWKRTHEDFNLRYNPETGRVDLRPLEVQQSVAVCPRLRLGARAPSPLRLHALCL